MEANLVCLLVVILSVDASDNIQARIFFHYSNKNVTLIGDMTLPTAITLYIELKSEAIS